MRCASFLQGGGREGVLTTRTTTVAMAVETEVEVDEAMVVAVSVSVANVVDAASFETRLRSRLLPCQRGPWRRR